MEYDEFVDQLKRHEGFRGEVYMDTEGIPTGGWGHAFIEGSPVPIEIAERFLWHDLYEVSQAYDTLGLSLDPLDTVREYVIKNMLFNLGLSKLRKFKKMLAAIRSGNYRRAADEMLNSKWARQVKTRAVELAEMMKSGEYQGKSYLKGKI